MFITQSSGNTIIFRDQYDICLNPELYGKPELAKRVINKIFDTDEVLIVEPIISYVGDTVMYYISVATTVRAIDNMNDCNKLTEKFNKIDGVVFSQPKLILNGATHKEIIDNFYGGVQRK